MYNPPSQCIGFWRVLADLTLSLSMTYPPQGTDDASRVQLKWLALQQQQYVLKLKFSTNERFI